jgi:competence protein ComEA
LATDGGAGERSEGGGGKIVVHVAGAVQTPGVVELPAGSRIHEAVEAAGGGLPGADLNRLNLAAVLTDGQKVHVPLVGEQLSADPARDADGDAAGAGAAATDRIDLNTASADELGTLPRVGPVLAQRIVDWRKEHGNFKTVEELDAVDGVGPKMLETLLPLVTV